jgi:hypothetical protein
MSPGLIIKVVDSASVPLSLKLRLLLKQRLWPRKDQLVVQSTRLLTNEPRAAHRFTRKAFDHEISLHKMEEAGPGGVAAYWLFQEYGEWPYIAETAISGRYFCARPNKPYDAPAIAAMVIGALWEAST